MAYYAALTSLLETLEQIPRPVEEITNLKEKVRSLLTILEESSSLDTNSTISHLEGQIRAASYEAEDILQAHMHKNGVLSESTSNRAVISCIQMTITPFRRSMESTDLNKLIQALGTIIEKFDSILEALSKIGEENVEDDPQPIGSSLTAVASSLRSVAPKDKSPMVGADEDLCQIKERLIGWESKLTIIPIVGMGGSGKTTLARNLYGDWVTEQHFDSRAWVVVSQQYDMQQVLIMLLASIGCGASKMHQKKIQELKELLHKSLYGKRYLIVMDDVWDIKVWNEVRMYFPDVNNGSRIILTTRLSEVASYANSDSFIHQMRLLSSEASWDLLRQKVFGGECCPSPLEEIGRKIADNCRGLPLTIVVMGGLLSKGSKEPKYWHDIAKNVQSTLFENDDIHVIELLSLSYNSLPHHLKACFLYMGAFPEDHVIFVSQLVKLWIAEGFIKPLNHESLEEVARDYLKDLIDRSLIMVHTRNHNGGVKTCIIHDLLRQFCVEKAQDDKFLRTMNSDVCNFREGRNNIRRVSIHSNKSLLDIGNDFYGQPVRSLLYFSRSRSFKQLMSVTMRCRLLRVLDALGIRFYGFPTEILELVHLRYLAFMFSRGRKLPASISKLCSLQTLIVYRGYASDFGSYKPFYVPSTIWKMTQLRHIMFDGSFLPCPISSLNRDQDPIVLVSLETLSKARNFRCSKGVFKIMPNLKKLGIIYDCAKWSLSEFTNFVYLDKLETLKCCYKVAPNALPVNFAFPQTLKKLTLGGFRFSWREMTVIGQLPYLEVLKLKCLRISFPVWEPNEGEFNSLKFLFIERCFLEHWRAKDTHFPQLQHVRLICLTTLASIPSEIADIPTFEMLELLDCGPAAELSAKQIQQEQEALGNNSLKVRLTSLTDDGNHDKYTSLEKVHRSGSIKDIEGLLYCSIFLVLWLALTE